MNKFLSTFLVLTSIILLPFYAQAIERYSVEVLPDFGAGSSTIGTSSVVIEEMLHIVVGNMFRPEISDEVAVVWGLFFDEADAWIPIYPHKDGLERSSANGFGYIGETEKKLVIAGDSFDTAGKRIATVWTDMRPLRWTGQALPTPAGFESTANAVAFAPLKPAEYVVGSLITPAGVSRAVVWEGDLLGNWEIAPLPALGGPDTPCRATAVVINHEELVIVGSSQLAGNDNEWRAVSWEVNGEGVWEVRDLGALRNGQSQANGVSVFPGLGSIAVGESTVGNVTRATGWAFDDAAERKFSFGVPEGYGNSSANALILREDDILGFQAAGTAWDDAMDVPFAGYRRCISPLCDGMTGVIFNQFSTIGTANSAGVYPANSLIEDTEWNVIALNGLAPDGTISGMALPVPTGEGDLPRAALMVPANVHMPDEIKVKKGKMVLSSTVRDAWWADGKYLRIKAPDRRGLKRKVDGIFKFQMPVILDRDYGANIVVDTTMMGITDVSSPVTWTQQLQAYNFVLKKWDTLSINQFGTLTTKVSAPVPGDPTEYIKAGEVLIRIKAISDLKSGRWGIGIDELSVYIEEIPSG